MKIESLSLVDFRNFAKINISFHKNITVFIGDNGEGKTNLLESVYFLSTGRSFRIKDEQQLIRKNYEMARISAIYNDGDVKNTVTAVLHPQGKSILINKTPITSIRSFIGKIHTVLFSPMDMDFFDTSPKNRRKFLDVEGSKCSQTLVESLFSYNQLLKERNIYLKQEKVEEEYLLSLDHQLATTQEEIIKFRLDFIQHLNETLTKIYSHLSSEDVIVDVEYDTVFDLVGTNYRESVMSVLQSSRKRDLFYRVTHAGVHRDDMIVKFNGFNVEEYASQGQKRLLIIAIKLSLVRYIQKTKHVTPILLLDDVFSEIDQEKKVRFLDSLPKDIQTIITTTDLNDIRTISEDDVIVYRVAQGSLVKGV